MHNSVRTTGNMAVAAMNEANGVERRLILLREPALRKKEGDRAAALRPCCVVRWGNSFAIRDNLSALGTAQLRTGDKQMHCQINMALKCCENCQDLVRI